MTAINPLLAATDAPPIPEARAWTRCYAGALGPLVDLSQAAPGAPPPPEMLARLGLAAADPEAARYGDIAGDPALREAYAGAVAALYGGAVAADEVAITAGCNQGFFVAMMALARAAEAVILPTPWYFNHKTTLDMLGIAAVPLPCTEASGFVPDVDAAERLIDRRVRAIVLVTPNNPTGAICPPETIARFAALCRRRGIGLVLDETYRDFLPAAGARPHALFSEPGLRASFIQLYSFSKAYGIPGHRVGAMVADSGTIGEVVKVLDNLQICAPRAPQMVLPWAIGALAAWREAGRVEIAKRGAAFGRMLADVPGWRIDSIGAYFAYVRHPCGDLPAAAVAERLAVERGVLCLPGSYFGPWQEGHVRIAIANVDAATIAGLGPRFVGLGAPR